MPDLWATAAELDQWPYNIVTQNEAHYRRSVYSLLQADAKIYAEKSADIPSNTKLNFNYLVQLIKTLLIHSLN